MKFRKLNKLLLESYNFYYTVPTDKKELLFDFYSLNVLPYPKDSNLQVNLDETRKIILEESRKSLLSSVFFAICAEARHMFNGNKFEDKIKPFFGLNPVDQSVEDEKHKKSEVMNTIKDAFDEVNITLDYKTIYEIYKTLIQMCGSNKMQSLSPKFTRTIDDFENPSRFVIFGEEQSKIYNAMLKMDKYFFVSDSKSDEGRAKKTRSAVHIISQIIEGKFSPEKIHQNNSDYGKFILSYQKQYEHLDNVIKGKNIDADFVADDTYRWDKQRFAENKQEYNNSYKTVNNALKKSGLSRFDFINIMRSAFVLLNWASSYGGIPWSSICNGWMELEQASISNPGDLSIWIDHVYDLQHNTDTVFNKIRSYYRAYPDDGYTWIVNALDKKRDAENVWDLYSSSSTQLQGFMLRVLKDATGQTLEMWMDKAEKLSLPVGGLNWLDNVIKQTKKLEKGAEWTGGVWTGGVWDGGLWKDGLWKKGLWKQGTWKGGHWNGGTWETGIWEGGWIYDPNKEGKKAYVDTLEWDGEYVKTIKDISPAVYFGQPKGPYTDSSAHKDELPQWFKNNLSNISKAKYTMNNGILVWEIGIWENGTWKNGTWKNGKWKYGWWNNGVWKGGTWEGGVWEDGTWENGLWKGGLIYDPNKDGKKEYVETLEWDGDYVKTTKGISPAVYFGQPKGPYTDSSAHKDELPQWFKNNLSNISKAKYTMNNGILIWEKGWWQDGIWNGGTWEGGIWRGGQWNGGTWENGFWENGIWEGGTWENGLWKGGTWLGGIWKGGLIYDPNKKGKKEYIETLEWKGDYVITRGISPSAYFGQTTSPYTDSSAHKDELPQWFKNNLDNTSKAKYRMNNGILIWETGTWEYGTWYGGTWETGIWEYGTWKGGTWENGWWYNGTWEGGTWYNGLIYDPNKKGKKEYVETLEWDGNYVIAPKDINPAVYFGQATIPYTKPNPDINKYNLPSWFKNNLSNISKAKYTMNNGILIWETGTWEFGTWKGGTWEFGTWEDGWWNGGTWNGGWWQNGNWEDGTWVYGTWENGWWYNGTWLGGLWKGGWIFDPDKKGKREYVDTLEWKGAYVKTTKGISPAVYFGQPTSPYKRKITSPSSPIAKNKDDNASALSYSSMVGAKKLSEKWKPAYDIYLTIVDETKNYFPPKHFSPFPIGVFSLSDFLLLNPSMLKGYPMGWGNSKSFPIKEKPFIEYLIEGIRNKFQANRNDINNATHLRNQIRSSFGTFLSHLDYVPQDIIKTSKALDLQGMFEKIATILIKHGLFVDKHEKLLRHVDPSVFVVNSEFKNLDKILKVDWSRNGLDRTSFGTFITMNLFPVTLILPPKLLKETGVSAFQHYIKLEDELVTWLSTEKDELKNGKMKLTGDVLSKLIDKVLPPGSIVGATDTSTYKKILQITVDLIMSYIDNPKKASVELKSNDIMKFMKIVDYKYGEISTPKW